METGMPVLSTPTNTSKLSHAGPPVEVYPIDDPERIDTGMTPTYRARIEDWLQEHL